MYLVKHLPLTEVITEAPFISHKVLQCGTLRLLKTIALALLFLSAAFAARQPFAPGDLWLWRTPAAPEIAPDGSQVVFTEAWNDRSRDAVYDNLWLAASDGSGQRQLTEGNWRDRSPRWSPDGANIAYLSDRQGVVQIWVRSVKTGEEHAAARGGPAPLALAWSPDGKSIAFTARVAPSAGPPAWVPKELLPFLWPPPQGPVQVFVVSAAGGQPVQLSGPDLDFQGEPAWMPDGASILCEAAGQIFSIRLADRAVRELTREDTLNATPVPSPDGRKIAFLARGARPQNYAVRQLCVMNADGSRVRILAGTLGRDAMHPQWSNDSRTIYFTADDHGATHVYAAHNDGTVRQVTARPELLRGFTLANNGRAAAVRYSAGEGGAVVTFAVDLPAGVATAASPNEHFLAEREIGAVEEVDYPSAGKQIQAWLVKPARFDAARRYPLLVLAQDAPRRMFGAAFQLRAQIFAAAGFVVLCANPRGTPGYGEEFGNLLPTAFPGDPAGDLERGVEFAAAKPFVDPGRIAVMGGPEAAWLASHSTRVSRAVLRGVFAGAMPGEDAGQYLKRSPLLFAGAFHAAALIVAAPDDARSEELYRALQQNKAPAALVRLGDQKPSERVLALEAELAWLAQH